MRDIDANLLLTMPAPAWAEEHMRLQQAEIERLLDAKGRMRVDLANAQSDNARLTRINEKQCSNIAFLDAEIERLLAESEAFRGKLAEQCGQTLVARAEIERLTADYARLQESIQLLRLHYGSALDDIKAYQVALQQIVERYERAPYTWWEAGAVEMYEIASNALDAALRRALELKPLEPREPKP